MLVEELLTLIETYGPRVAKVNPWTAFAVAAIPGIIRAIVEWQDRPEEIDWDALVLPKLRDSLREKGIDPDTMRPM